MKFGWFVRSHLPKSLVALLAIISTGAFACGDGARTDGRPPAVTTAVPQSIDEAYTLMREAMDGDILHSNVSVTNFDGDQEERDHTREYWINAADDTARMQYTLDPSADSYDRATSSTTIVVGNYVFTPDDEDEALRSEMRDRCPGSDDVLIAFLLGCDDGTDHYDFSQPELDTAATYEGDRAIAIVSEAPRVGGHTTSTTFIDPETMLPLATTIETSGGGERRRVVAEYEHEFVAADTLDDGFLDPRSIGYGVEPGATDVNDGAVYWVGDEYETPDGDEFVLVRLPDPLYGERSHLIYQTPEGLDGFDVFTWTPEGWEAFLRSEIGAVMADQACVPQTRLPGRDDVLVYNVPWPNFPVVEHPNPTVEQACEFRIASIELVRWAHMAVVRYDDVVVTVSDQQHDLANVSLLTAVVEALRPR